jgi:hypothetical protein
MYIESKDLGALSSTTLDITASGLGGLDASSTETISTWYFVFATAKSDFSAKNVILSSNATTPDLTGTGHSKYRRIGRCYNNSGGALNLFSQQNGSYFWTTEQQLLLNGTATTPTTVSAATAIPPTDTALLLSVRTLMATTTASYSEIYGYIGGAYVLQFRHRLQQVGGDGSTTYLEVETYNRNIQYRRIDTNVLRVDIYAIGFRVEL